VVGEDGNDPMEDSEHGLWDDLQYLWGVWGGEEGRWEGGRDGGREGGRRERERGRERPGIGFQQTLDCSFIQF